MGQRLDDGSSSPAAPAGPRGLRGALGADVDLPGVVRAYFDAINAEDWSTLQGVWAADAELRAVGTRPRRGRDDVMTYFRSLFRPWPVHDDRPTRWIVADGVVVTEVRFVGATVDGKEIGFDAVDVFDVADGQIARMTSWYDLSWVRAQL